MAKNKEILIEAKNLKKYFPVRGKGMLHAVDDVSFTVNVGETLGLVGESGCGKSTVGNLIMRLLPPTEGQLFYRGENVYEADKARSFELRRKMQIVFQDPYSSLNSKQTIGAILRRPFEIQGTVPKNEWKDRILELCKVCGLNPSLLDHYPHELDGGNRQVVGIARALSLDPEFVVCDEPVSALDVSVQAKIINKLMDLQEDRKLSYLFVSHDMSVVKHISHRIAVMYLGQIVELAETEELFDNPMHPYTAALLSAVPRVDVDHKVERIVLKGDVPSPMNPKPGCRFAPRCPMARQECFGANQTLTEMRPGHFVRCEYAGKM